MMVRGIYNFFVFFILLNIIPFASVGQKNQDLFSFDLWNLPLKAEMDTNTNIKNISIKEFKSLINKLYEIDQKYRKSLEKISRTKQPELYLNSIKKMRINDKSNQIILLKLVKKFGWPCDNSFEQSVKPWVIVWHAEADNKVLFYPFIRIAHNKGCINEDLYNYLNIK